MNNPMVPALKIDLDYGDRKIRVVGTPERPEWVAADVCEVLGIDNPSKALLNFSDTEKGGVTIGNTPLLTVTEPGLYRLIFKSRKPEAERFRQWVTHEVLPCIRQHGCYPAPEVQLWNDRVIVTVDSDALIRGLSPILQPLAISQARLEHGQQQLRDEVQDFRHEVDGRFDDMGDRISRIEHRRALSVKTQRLHTVVVWKRFDGRCPCCQRVAIVDHEGFRLENAHFDHWRQPSENGKDVTWLICYACNQLLRNGDEKRKRQDSFHHYQRIREDYEVARQPRLPGF